MINKIDLSRITLKDLLQWFKDYANNKGIMLEICEDNYGYCFANVEDKIIILNIKNFNKAQLAFAFFHEIGHFKIWENDLFKVARKVCEKEEFDRLSVEEKIIYRKTTLRLEQWCDNYGEKEALKYFKNPHCYKPYSIDRIKDLFRQDYYFK